MKVSLQTQTVYFLDIYQVEVSKDNLFTSTAARSKFVDLMDVSSVRPLSMQRKLRWYSQSNLASTVGLDVETSRLDPFPQ